MNTQVISGIIIPLLGTIIGSAGVFFLKKSMRESFTDILSAIAAGIMTAASIWSLIIPAINRSESMGKFAFVPAAVGFMSGIFFLIFTNVLVEKIYSYTGKKCSTKKLTTTFLAVTIHNFPEGMAVGSIFAAYLAGEEGVPIAAAMVLSFGIAVQNIPEGAIISMPLQSCGVGKWKAFSIGALSGIVEPLGAILTILAARVANVFLPYLLSFAAGAMMFVVTEQLIPEIKERGRLPIRSVPFAVGFIIMMSLDVALS